MIWVSGALKLTRTLCLLNLDYLTYRKGMEGLRVLPGARYPQLFHFLQSPDSETQKHCQFHNSLSKGDQLQFDGVGGSGSSSNGPTTRDGDGGGDFEDVDVKDPHVTRLFYLQLYSSVLKAEREAQEEIRRSLLFQQGINRVLCTMRRNLA